LFKGIAGKNIHKLCSGALQEKTFTSFVQGHYRKKHQQALFRGTTGKNINKLCSGVLQEKTSSNFVKGAVEQKHL
jgi:hypothetical protein